MDSEVSEKTTPRQESSKADNPTKQKQEIVIVIIVKDGNKELINECLESLKKECAQNHLERSASFEEAFDYIKQLDTNTIVILIVTGRSHETLKNDLQHIDSLPRAIHALDASPVFGHSDDYTSITVHENTFNKLFAAMKTLQFKHLGFTIKISQMEAKLSPSIFHFTAFAEVFATLDMLPHWKQTVHGECELTLDEKTGKLLLNIKKLMIELPKICGFGGGFTDISDYIHPIPLKGFINFTHPFDLPHTCETRRLLIVPLNQKFIVEEKRATFSVEIDYTEGPEEKK